MGKNKSKVVHVGAWADELIEIIRERLEEDLGFTPTRTNIVNYAVHKTSKLNLGSREYVSVEGLRLPRLRSVMLTEANVEKLRTLMDQVPGTIHGYDRSLLLGTILAVTAAKLIEETNAPNRIH